MENEEARKSDTDVLFPDQKIYGEDVKPWTYPQFRAVVPDLVMTAKVLKQAGVTMEEVSNVEAAEFEKVMALIEKSLPALPVCEVVSKTLDKDLKEVEEWDFDKPVGLFLLIMIQNMRRVKNLFGLGLSALQAMKKTV